MVGAACRQMPARPVAVSKRKRYRVAGVVLDLLHRRSRPWVAGLDEPEPSVAHPPPAGLAVGDDGFVQPQLGDGAEDGAPLAVDECDDTFPRGNRCPGRRLSIGRSVVRPHDRSVHSG